MEQDFHGDFQVNVTWFFACFSGVLDWIVLILVWFERSLHSAHVSGQSCPWPLKLMTSQRVQRTRIRTGGYRWFRGEWVNDDLCGQSVIGRKLLESFMNEKIKSDKVNIWSKTKNKKTWGSLSKTKLWNYRKTATCLPNWWWSPKVVLKSTSKRLSHSMSFQAFHNLCLQMLVQCFIAQWKTHSWVFWRRLVDHVTLQGLTTVFPPQLHP